MNEVCLHLLQALFTSTTLCKLCYRGIYCSEWMKAQGKYSAVYLRREILLLSAIVLHLLHTQV